MSSKLLATVTFLVSLLVIAETAGAHPWPYHVGGFSAGIEHPFTGIDHILAMLAVGVCAAQRGGRALWLLPTTFLVCMIAGGIAGLGRQEVRIVEQGIAASVLILGLMIAGGARLSGALMILLIGTFAVFHGYAHGAELQPGNAPFTYAIGFIIATVILLLIGIKVGLSLRHFRSMTFARILGGAVSLVGIILFWI